MRSDAIKKTTVAFQGVAGTYGQLAVQKYFGKNITTLLQPTLEDIFTTIDIGLADYGLIPLEKSFSGTLHQNYDLLTKHNLPIQAEIYLRITHHLLAVKASMIRSLAKRLKLISRVYVHPHALEHCQQFFSTYPWMNPISTMDSSSSILTLSTRAKLEEAVITGTYPPKSTNLAVLKKNLETNKHNLTRFAVVGTKPLAATPNKVSLIFTVKHKPAALFNSLKLFADRNINLTKIESRPIPERPREYLFYLDFEVNSSTEKRDQAIGELKKLCSYLKVLGFYNKGKHVH